jgi:hypothetical protein
MAIIDKIKAQHAANKNPIVVSPEDAARLAADLPDFKAPDLLPVQVSVGSPVPGVLAFFRGVPVRNASVMKAEEEKAAAAKEAAAAKAKAPKADA